MTTRGANKCAACGQFSGRGHRCPTAPPRVTATTIDTRSTTTDRALLAARVARAAATLTTQPELGFTIGQSQPFTLLPDNYRYRYRAPDTDDQPRRFLPDLPEVSSWSTPDGLNVTTGECLPIQGLYTKDPFFADDVRPIANRPYANKPTGGLWTSSIRDQWGTTAWLDFCATEYHSNLQYMNYATEIIPDPDSRILVINSLDDLHAAHDRYPGSQQTEKYGDRLLSPLDYEAITQDFDAIHLTENGAGSTRHGNYGIDLYGWDIESTLWLRP